MKVVPNSTSVLAPNEVRFADVIAHGDMFQVWGVIRCGVPHSFWTTESEAQSIIDANPDDELGLFDELAFKEGGEMLGLGHPEPDSPAGTTR